jgi:hypothetical protein
MHTIVRHVADAKHSTHRMSASLALRHIEGRVEKCPYFEFSPQVRKTKKTLGFRKNLYQVCEKESRTETTVHCYVSGSYFF